MPAATLIHTTREEWLTAAIEALAPLFKQHGHTVPPVRVSVGWPGGRGPKQNVVGQCWGTTSAADGTAQMFISPIVSDPYAVLGILAHELAHAVDDCRNGHRAPFVRIIRSIGLAGKPTATTPGPELEPVLHGIIGTLGMFPHATLTAACTKKQTTRMLKLVCPECGYTIRTTAKWLETGVPTCPCGSTFEVPSP